MTNYDVLNAWSKSKNIESRSNLTTNGYDLYSYSLKIGYTNPHGKKILKLYLATTNNYYSMTTSKHVGQAKVYADIHMIP